MPLFLPHLPNKFKYQKKESLQVPDQKARMRAQRNIIPANRAHPSAVRYSLIVCSLRKCEIVL
jgi:hypothetical protein